MSLVVCGQAQVIAEDPAVVYRSQHLRVALPVVDDDGRATVEIPLNDSLTSFRVVAIASSGAGLFGYSHMMGGYAGGQAEYVMVPYADWNLLKFPDKDQAMEKILDLTMLSDIFPTGFHGAYTAGVGPGSTVYIAGAGPVGLAAAHSAQLLGAAVVFVGDPHVRALAERVGDLGGEQTRARRGGCGWGHRGHRQ